MKWFESSVAIAAMLAVAVGPIAPGLGGHAVAQETLDDLPGRDLAEVAALPEDEPLDELELDELVAPVALYPDALLAQVLVAATYPLQIVKADRLLDETEGLSDDEVAQRIAEQDWDPSVMVLLSGFPTVVQRMADDLDWTERLGIAMVGQDEDLLAAVQRMRTRATDTGWLESNDAQVVERSDAVTIRPADPDVVYVPSYDSSLAYTSAPTAQPYIAPSSNPLANPLVAGAIAFGAALLVQQLFEDDDNDRERGWDSYWRRSDPFDWRERQFYPRPNRGWQRNGNDYAWSRERNDHWDHDRRTWAYEGPARADRDRERRAAVAWTARPGREGLDRIGQLRTVARERPPQLPAAKPKAKTQAKPVAAPRAVPAAARPDAKRPNPVAVATPAKNPEAKPKPQAQAKPKPKSQGQQAPNPKPQARAKPKPQAQAKPKPKPQAQQKSKPKPQAQQKSKPEPQAKPEDKAKAKAVPAVARPAAKPAVKPPAEARPAKKPQAKPNPKPKPEVQAQAKQKPKAQAKQKPKLQAKPKAKPKPQAKQKPKPLAKPKAKPKPQAQAQNKPKKQQAKPARAQKKQPAKKKPACKPGNARCKSAG